MPHPIHRRAGREAQSALRIEFRSEPAQMRKTGLAAVTALHLQLGRVMTDGTFSHSCLTTSALLMILHLCAFHASHERTLERPVTFDAPGFSEFRGGVSSFSCTGRGHGDVTAFDQEFPNTKENGVPSGGGGRSSLLPRLRTLSRVSAARSSLTPQSDTDPSHRFLVAS